MSLDVLVPFELSVGSPIDTRKRKIPCRRELLIKSLQQFHLAKAKNEKVLNGTRIGFIGKLLVDTELRILRGKETFGFLFRIQDLLSNLHVP